MVWFYSITSVVIVSLISLVGVLSIVVGEKRTEKALLILVSFAAGGLLGDTFIHLLPEVAENQGLNLETNLAILVGILTFFILEKFIAWRHCHIPTSKDHPHPVVFMNLIGDGLHNFIDGVIIGATFVVSLSLGIATSIAVIFHEIPQEIGDFGVLIHGGFSKKKAIIFNFLSSLMAILGTIFVLSFGPRISGFSESLIPFTAGGFIYIASTDLIPELHKETRPQKSLVQLLGLLAGIGIMLGLKFIS
ncbi:MAG: ZIP family metal transporter [Patescibacteria group bacterium]